MPFGGLRELRPWFELLQPLAHVLLVWLLAWLLLRSMRRLLLAFRNHVTLRVDESRDSRRIETLINVFRYAATITIVAVAGMLALGEIGITITPLLATAGVAGIAIGFGAQSLVKDFFSGLFLLLENQVSEGDHIEAGGKTGRVESVTLRHIRMRDLDGSVHFIPNGMITTVTNHSRDYAYAVIDLSVARSADIDHVLATMRSIGDAMRGDPAFAQALLAEVDIDGIEKLEEGSVLLRCRLKTLPSQQWRVRREFLRRMEHRLDTRS